MSLNEFLSCAVFTCAVNGDASSVSVEPSVLAPSASLISRAPTSPTPTGTPSPTRNPTEQPPEPKQLPFTNPPPVRIEELEEYIQMKKSAAADEGFEADYKVNIYFCS